MQVFFYSLLQIIPKYDFFTPTQVSQAYNIVTQIVLSILKYQSFLKLGNPDFAE